MYGVSTSHKNDGLRRREHVLATYGTVAVGRSFDAAVILHGADGQACVTGLHCC